ncbi:unnamed protein product [Amoebophrya sp. A120]|nr:unnamed protein product [Amoebophrya sp. A120]|eukprot:GSA120T00011549001.1
MRSYAASAAASTAAASSSSSTAVRRSTTSAAMQSSKISENGTSQALFIECLNKIRETRLNVENHATQNLMRRAKEEIRKLTNDEIHLVRKQFERLEHGDHVHELKSSTVKPDTTARVMQRDGGQLAARLLPGGDPASTKASASTSVGAGSTSSALNDPTIATPLRRSFQEHNIDPYWDPFFEVQTEKERVNAEFVEYAKVVSAAEAREKRLEIRRAVRRAVVLRYGSRYDPLKYHGGEQLPQDVPKPHRLHERFWTPNDRQQKINAERAITWRDVDLLQHHLAPNGWILPRRTTMLSRKNQRRMTKAVNTARAMALLPFDWRPSDFESMPLMDPLQFTVDRLTNEVAKPRARAMLEVMQEKYPELNFRAYDKWKTELFRDAAKQEKRSSRAASKEPSRTGAARGHKTTGRDGDGGEQQSAEKGDAAFEE